MHVAATIQLYMSDKGSILSTDDESGLNITTLLETIQEMSSNAMQQAAEVMHLGMSATAKPEDAYADSEEVRQRYEQEVSNMLDKWEDYENGLLATDTESAAGEQGLEWISRTLYEKAYLEYQYAYSMKNDWVSPTDPK